MGKALKYGIITFIFIGLIMFTFNYIFGNGTINLITKENMNGITYWKIDTWAYIENLQTSLGQTTYLQLTQPSRNWINITSNILQEQFWADLVNNLALILDWILFGLNVLIYPFRLGGFILKQFFVIIGMDVRSNTTSNLQWLVNLCNFLISLQIPYV